MYSKIAKWLMWGLVILGIILMVFAWAADFEGGIVDSYLRYTYVLAIAAVALVIILGIAIGAINNPKSLIKLLLGIVAVAAVVAVVYATASGAPLVNYLGDQPEHSVLKRTDTLLNLTYVLGACAIIAIIVGEVISSARNK